MGLVGLASVAIPLAGWAVLRSSPLSEIWQERLLHLVQFETSATALWFQWCLGMLAVEGYYGLIRLPAWSRRLWLSGLWLGAALVADARGWQLASPALWGLAWFTFVNLVVTSERPGGIWTSSPLAWLVRLGTIGYSVYLIHSPFIGALNQAGRLIVGEESSLAVQPAFHLAVWVLLVVACCAAGWLYFQLAERWFVVSPARQARG